MQNLLRRTVVNGRVYVPTFFPGQLAVYGLLSSGSPSRSEVKISAIANSASLLGDVYRSSVKSVAIYRHKSGNRRPPFKTEIDGRWATSPNILAGTQVLFKWTSRTCSLQLPSEKSGRWFRSEIDPWGINGPATQVQIVYDERWSPGVTRCPLCQRTRRSFASRRNRRRSWIDTSIQTAP